MLLMSSGADRSGNRFKQAALTLVAAGGIPHRRHGKFDGHAILGFGIANIGVHTRQSSFWTIPPSTPSRSRAPAAIGLIGMPGSAGGAVMTIVVERLNASSHIIAVELGMSPRSF